MKYLVRINGDGYLSHAGHPGMKWGKHLFGDRDYDPIGQEAQGTYLAKVRSAKAAGQAGRKMETWELKDRVDRLKAENDYADQAMKKATYSQTISDQLSKRAHDKVFGIVDDVSKILSTARTGMGLYKDVKQYQHDHSTIGRIESFLGSSAGKFTIDVIGSVTGNVNKAKEERAREAEIKQKQLEENERQAKRDARNNAEIRFKKAQILNDQPGMLSALDDMIVKPKKKRKGNP